MTELQRDFSAYIAPFGGETLTDEPLKNHCSFRIGGPAELMYIPSGEKGLAAALKYAFEKNTPLCILGNGSNVLINDEGLKGITVRLMGGLTELIYLGDGVISCGAGVSLKKLCMFALENSLTGLEFAYGIPGSVGGAVYMNAGAYGGEIKDALYSVRSIDRSGGEITETKVEDGDFSYRSTPYMRNGSIITAGIFKLQNGDKNEIKAKMDELLARRRDKQPLEFPSAGSTFRRPKGYFAGALIEQCGLKGRRVGGAEVSEKHAGFVINRDNASFDDVKSLIGIIRETVLAQKGVELVPEVVIL